MCRTQSKRPPKRGSTKPGPRALDEPQKTSNDGSVKAPSSTRKLPNIPAEPKPTRKQINASLRQHADLLKGLPPGQRLPTAEFFWWADERQKYPDLFWHPFAPDPVWYEAYLRSPEWRRIGDKVKENAGHKCACCPNRATQVHHRCYRPRVLAGEDLSLLIALCGRCHKTIDFDERGKVREANEKERVLAALFHRESERLTRVRS
jgi:hypothetical protein